MNKINQVLKCEKRCSRYKDHSHKAKHAPIALTLLDYFSMATTKALKIQQDDASKWDALSLVESHHKEH
jgi:hypothetical protein